MTAIQWMSEWVIRSSILILAGALLVSLLRLKSPSVRQVAWTVMLAGSLAIPLLTTVLPKVRFDVGRAPAGPLAPVFDAAASHDAARLPRPATTDSISGAETLRPVAGNPFDWLRAAAILYALAAGALLLRLVAGLAVAVRILRRSRPAGIIAEEREARESADVASPVTIGVLRPAIVLPVDWRRWDPATLNAVLAHERSHIRRRDPALQFLSAAHRALLWANPLSWFLHRNIVRTAEEISDDDAIRTTRDRVSYAEILLGFMQRDAGLSSSPGIPMARYERPERRIRRILNSTAVSRVATRWSVSAILTVIAPLAYLAAAADPQPAPQAAPQSASQPVVTEKLPQFEVASIKPAPPPPPPKPNGPTIIRVGFGPMPGGGFRASNITLTELISNAYRINCHDRCRDFITGGPDWIGSARYDILARAPQPPADEEKLDHLTADQRRKHRDELLMHRIQALLADRFQLVLRDETRAGQTFALRVAKNGHKLKPGTGEDGSVKGGDGRFTAENISMKDLALELTNMLGQPVADKTGLTGEFNFKLDWTPLPDDDAQDEPARIFSALQRQLGLRLEPVKGVVRKLVVVRAERPSEN
jgi:bla regulator protein blaR1